MSKPPRTEPKARQRIRIERDPNLPEHRAMYTVVTPVGWCFEPGRHNHVVPTKEEAKKAKREETIEPCAPDCDACFDEDEPEDSPGQSEGP